MLEFPQIEEKSQASLRERGLVSEKVLGKMSKEYSA